MSALSALSLPEGVLLAIVLKYVWAYGSCLLLTLLPCPDEQLVSFTEYMPEGKILPTLVGLYHLVVILEQPLPNIFEDTLPLCYLQR